VAGVVGGEWKEKDMKAAREKHRARGTAMDLAINQSKRRGKKGEIRNQAESIAESASRGDDGLLFKNERGAKKKLTKKT